MFLYANDLIYGTLMKAGRFLFFWFVLGQGILQFIALDSSIDRNLGQSDCMIQFESVEDGDGACSLLIHPSV